MSDIMTTSIKEVEIYTDGACSGNPGPGGYGAILRYCGHELEISGGFRRTTNNRMELFAAIVALEALTEPCKVRLFSDSSYLVNAIEKHWLTMWQKNNWRKRDKNPVMNEDLWKRFLRASSPHQLEMIWVKGHSSNELNNRCDTIAVAAAAKRNALPQDLPS